MLSLTRPARRTVRSVAVAVMVGLLSAGPVAATAAELPPGPVAPAPAPDPLDAYVKYQAQSTCDPTPKPGATYIIAMILDHWRIGRNTGIGRACTVGGTSEHKEGRAIDWAVNVANPAEKIAGDSFVNWVTAVGPDGKAGYNARRLGIMYLIWNGHIWYNNGPTSTWRVYTGSNPHTDHVHISLTWNGAYKRSSWWTGTAVPAEATVRRYVVLVYRDLFGRDPDPAGLATWTDALVNMTPRVSVANAITSSTEYRSRLVTSGYQEFLERTPDQQGMTTWLTEMSKGMTIQTMESGFLSSQEYYLRSGGTDAAWVKQLYRDVLNREAGASEVEHWVGNVAKGQTRDSVAQGFLLSTERLTTVINGYYVDLLGRSIDPAGRQGWVGAVQGGARTEAIIGGIVASQEYYNKAEFWTGS